MVLLSSHEECRQGMWKFGGISLLPKDEAVVDDEVEEAGEAEGEEVAPDYVPGEEDGEELEEEHLDHEAGDAGEEVRKI